MMTFWAAAGAARPRTRVKVRRGRKSLEAFIDRSPFKMDKLRIAENAIFKEADRLSTAGPMNQSSSTKTAPVLAEVTRRR